MNLDPATAARSRELLNLISLYQDQAEACSRELYDILGLKEEQEQPLAIIGNGEYAGVIEAKPRKEGA